jgi:parallel beta-helix repeat protein
MHSDIPIRESLSEDSPDWKEVNRTMRSSKAIITYGLFILTGMYFVPDARSSEITVTNTNESGEGSLREALTIAQERPGPDTILFNIPESDPGYDPMTGVWCIMPSNGYLVPPGITVDGSLAPMNTGDTSKPGIEIDGTTLAPLGIHGFHVDNDVTLRGLIINHFQYGIWIGVANVTVEGCYVGTDSRGTTAKPNGLDGILIANGGVNAVIQDNLVSGNEQIGIRLFGASTTGNLIRNNRVGTDVSGAFALPNNISGIELQQGAHDNVIEGNLVSGNVGIGIHLTDAETSGNSVRNNRVGTDIDGTNPLSNTSFGIALFNGPKNNRIGPDNRVTFNVMTGILIDGSDSFTSTVGNTVTENSINSNGDKGIRNFRGGNTELTPPVIEAVTPNAVSGTAAPGLKIEVFCDEEDEGSVFIGAAEAGPTGSFSVQIPASLTLLHFFTATATDADGNTSEFSMPAVMTTLDEKPAADIPERFSLSQNRPNPFNPATIIHYSLPENADVRMNIFNIYGEKVISLVDYRQNTGFYTVNWDGRDASGKPVSGGIYLCSLHAGVFHQTISMLLLK